jgi:hypothetical protein
VISQEVGLFETMFNDSPQIADDCEVFYDMYCSRPDIGLEQSLDGFKFQHVMDHNSESESSDSSHECSVLDESGYEVEDESTLFSCR